MSSSISPQCQPQPSQPQQHHQPSEQHQQSEQQQQQASPSSDPPAHPWPFPFPPYPIQTSLIRAVSRTLDLGHVGIFESPTGTGKSLSLICSTVPWLIQHALITTSHHPSSSHSSSPGPVDKHLSAGSSGSKREVPSWIIDHELQSRKREAERQLQLKLQRDNRVANMHIPMELSSTSPTVPFPLATHSSSSLQTKRRRRSNSDSSESSTSSSESNKQRREEEQVFSKLRKIYYCSRTHSQLSQFLAELTRVYGRKISAVALGSRKQLCINESLPKNERLNEACLVGCGFLVIHVVFLSSTDSHMHHIYIYIYI